MADSSALEFIDSNVLVYAHDTSAGNKQRRARDLLTHLWESGSGCLSIQVLQEFYVNVTQKIPHPLGPDRAGQLISDLQMWRVHSPVPEDVLIAIALQARCRLSFWDSMILRSASALGCAVLWTEDLNDGQIMESVEVRNPF